MTEDTAAMALAKLSFALAPKQTAEEAAIQRGIDNTMAEVIKARGYNPNSLSPPVKVTPAGAVRVAEPKGERGWVEPSPLKVPEGTSHVERLTGGNPTNKNAADEG
jgi:hypothetical protein